MRRFWWAVVLLGCDKPAPPNAPPTDPPATASARCGEGGEQFHDYSFVPAGVRAAVRLDLASPDLDATLVRLSETARGDAHGLPIDVAFALGQWSWQVPLVRSTLGRAGHRPGELVYLYIDRGVSVWTWPSSCDLEAQTRAAAAGWSLAVKPSAFGAVARGGESFPYDVLYYRGAFVALAPGGKSSAVAQVMAAPVMRDAPAPGEVLGTAPAPIHLVLTGQALVDPEVDPEAEAEGEPLRQLTATPEGLFGVVPSASAKGASIQ
jgi:hypothetical protein